MLTLRCRIMLQNAIKSCCLQLKTKIARNQSLKGKQDR